MSKQEKAIREAARARFEKDLNHYSKCAAMALKKHNLELFMWCVERATAAYKASLEYVEEVK